ncbi:MAG: hypothetical protein HKL80_09865 [Acidimicrobiales bacterium]|nr:hypothetical protein [Acidimicrobiales bacterium]
MSGYFQSHWSCEDGGPNREQRSQNPSNWWDSGNFASELQAGNFKIQVTSRVLPVATMVVTRDPGELYLLRHNPGDSSPCFVDKLDPITLETIGKSGELPGGPTWPGSIGVHANGYIYVVFGNHLHKLDNNLTLVSSKSLPKESPYNGFIILDNGNIVTKNFGGSRPFHKISPEDRERCQVLLIDPNSLDTIDSVELEEASIARLSANDDNIFIVGDKSLFVIRVDIQGHLSIFKKLTYLNFEGQSYGWDCVVRNNSVWLLDNGDGSEKYNGSLISQGVSKSPLHLVHFDLDQEIVHFEEICGIQNGLIANPPYFDSEASVAIGFDSSNGYLSAFKFDRNNVDSKMPKLWSKKQNHGSHFLKLPNSPLIVTADYDPLEMKEWLVLLDLMTGKEMARIDSTSPLQSVIFPALGFKNDFYWCSFSNVTRVSFEK